MRLLVFVGLVLAVACQDQGPRPFTLGPGCWIERGVLGQATLRLHYADCERLNRDSLVADGWRIVWDTTYTG